MWSVSAHTLFWRFAQSTVCFNNYCNVKVKEIMDPGIDVIDDKFWNYHLNVTAKMLYCPILVSLFKLFSQFPVLMLTGVAPFCSYVYVAHRLQGLMCSEMFCCRPWLSFFHLEPVQPLSIDIWNQQSTPQNCIFSSFFCASLCKTQRCLLSHFNHFSFSF